MSKKRGSYLLYKESDDADKKYIPYGPRPRNRLAKRLQQTQATTTTSVSDIVHTSTFL